MRSAPARRRPSAGPFLLKWVRTALMLGPLLGPLASAAVAGRVPGAERLAVAEGWAVVSDAAAAGWVVAADAARRGWSPRRGARRARGFGAARGTESWAASGAMYAANPPAASENAERSPVGGEGLLWALAADRPPRRPLTALKPTPPRRTVAAPVALDWLSRSGLAAHPTERAVVVAGGPRLPAPPRLAAAVPPPLAAPGPRPVFDDSPLAPRRPLIAAKPSPARSAARAASVARTAAVARFLSATAPGTWAVPAARTAELAPAPAGSVVR